MRGEALIQAEKDSDRWMDAYPKSEPDHRLLMLQKKHDSFMDQIGLHTKKTDFR